MILSRISRPLAALFAAGVLLAGCTAAPPAPTDTFYRLDAAEGVMPVLGQPQPRVVEVTRFLAAGVLADRPVAHTSTGRVLEQYAYDFWIETPPVLLQQQLVEYLRAANVFTQVVTPELRARTDLTIRGRILRFEHLLPPSGAAGVAVSIELSLIDTATDDVKLLGTYVETVPADNTSVLAATSAMRQAVARIYARFVADITKT
ncbi:MAG TPA: ABC transporter [Rhodospirillum rubrum]|nr:ABC transporter [Rhodospirillum rubrum]